MTSSDSQMEMFGPADHTSTPAMAATYGLRVPHRSLLQGLEDGWLEPPAGQSGFLLPKASGKTPPNLRSKNTILTTLWVEPSQLPKHTILAHAHGHWQQVSTTQIPKHAAGLFWPGALPLTAITHATVPSNEAQHRLQGIARQVSNITLPTLETGNVPSSSLEPPLSEEIIQLKAITLPAQYDRVQGAMAMAWWAIPRTGPWYDLICTSFSQNTAALKTQATHLKAPWLCQLPWAQNARCPALKTQTMTLWRGTLTALYNAKPASPESLLRSIMAAAQSQNDGDGDWDWDWDWDAFIHQTHAILQAKSPIDISDMRWGPVGLAIQLFLSRREPDRYRTWMAAEPKLPPAVWWSGAILSGLYSGLKRLPAAFRGQAPLSRFLTEYPLQLADLDAVIEWKQRGNEIYFTRSGHALTAHGQKARGAWYEADLRHPENLKGAKALAHNLQWKCETRTLVLSDRHFAYTGSGQVIQTPQTIQATGEIALHLPQDAKIEMRFDPAHFRQNLAISGGRITQRPPHPRVLKLVPKPQKAPNMSQIPGLIYTPAFINASEESQLIQLIDQAPWLHALKRRVQHYGWEYDYKSATIRPEMYLGPLPPWAAQLARRLFEAGLLPWEADQVIVNEYIESQGISKHIDQPQIFEGYIATLSLVEAWHMRFRPPNKGPKVDHLLERGSVAILTGPARSEWTHEIPSRKKENGRLRQRRISVTFRRVKGTRPPSA